MPIPITITVQKGRSSGQSKEIVANGSIILDMDEDVFQIKLEDIEFNFEFVFDDSAAMNSARYRATGDKSLVIQLLNFNTMLSNWMHASIGMLNERELFVSLFVTNLNTNRIQPRMINYSFSLGKANG